MPKDIHAILFDLDGTLVDSAPDISHALATSFKALGLRAQSDGKVRQWVGNGIDKLIHRALTDSMDGIAEQNTFSQVKTLFFEHYKDNIGRRSKVFSGVTETLQKLSEKKILLGCVTNKDRLFTLLLLEAMNIKSYFKTIVGGDDVKHKKPDPEPLLFAAKQLGVESRQCLMIGDSKTDVSAANNADIDIVCVNYGYAQGVDLSQLNIQAMISNFTEIEALLEKNSFLTL